MKYILIFVSLIILPHANAQDVELVIASGLDWAQCVAISDNNKFVAKAIQNNVSIWDVKTGRMIRNVIYTDDLMIQADSIWFAPNNKKLVLELSSTNDFYEVELATGKNTFVQGPPFDYSNYTYKMNSQAISNMHLYSKAKNDLRFPSPDGSTEIVYRKIKNPYASQLMPFAYEILIKKGKKYSESLDTVYVASFVFSKDSRYLFANQQIYDLKSVRKICKLRTVPNCGNSILFVPGTHIPITTAVGSIRIWDFPEITDISVPDIINFKTSKNGNILICDKFNAITREKNYVLVDLKKKTVIGNGVSSKESGNLLDVSADGKRFCFLESRLKNEKTYEMEYIVQVYDVSSGKRINSIDDAIEAYFTADNNSMVITGADSYLYKYNLKTDEKISFPTNGVLPGTKIGGTSIDHKFVMGSSYEVKNEKEYQNRVNIWDAETGEIVFETIKDGYYLSAFQLSKDHKFFSFASSLNNSIFIYDLENGNQIYELKGHTSTIELTYFSDDNKRLISSSIDGTRRIWNLEKGTEMVSLISTGKNDYAIVTPNQYYYATKGAQKLIHFVKGINIYPFEQFDLKYNRPDIIIESMEASNQDLIIPFNLAYKKRLKRLGFTEDMLDGSFHLPIAIITNESELPVFTKSNKALLDISAKDDKYNLDRIIIRINEVPVHGKDGLSLRDKNINQFAEKIEIELSRGKNKIAVSTLNEKGVESISSVFTMEYLPPNEEKPNFYLFTIGVSKYEQSDYNLTYAAKDANDIQNLFSKELSHFNQVFRFNLTDEQVTKDAIIKIKEELKKSNVNDVVCVFYAGHGLLDADLNYFLASYNIDFNNPAEKGIAYEVFEDLLDDIPARKKLILIDACHSGEIDKDNVVLVENETELDENITFRAVTGTTLQRVGLSNSFELMKELFTDIRKSSGTMIISSAGGMEYAIEGDDWNNGVFTYSLINGLSNGKADFNQDGIILLSEMNRFVRNEVFELTNGKQQPTNRAEVIESDWRLW